MIKFGKNAYQLNDDYENFSDYEKERISELKTDAFFDYSEDCHYICYVITTPLEIKAYTSILKNNLIDYDCINLSSDILKNKIDLERDLNQKKSSDNSAKYSFFIDEINEWVYNNLDIDIVLDRISESGINLLNDTEKRFLENYKHLN